MQQQSCVVGSNEQAASAGWRLQHSCLPLFVLTPPQSPALCQEFSPSRSSLESPEVSSTGGEAI